MFVILEKLELPHPCAVKKRSEDDCGRRERIHAQQREHTSQLKPKNFLSSHDCDDISDIKQNDRRVEKEFSPVV